MHEIDLSSITTRESNFKACFPVSLFFTVNEALVKDCGCAHTTSLCEGSTNHVSGFWNSSYFHKIHIVLKKQKVNKSICLIHLCEGEHHLASVCVVCSVQQHLSKVLVKQLLARVLSLEITHQLPKKKKVKFYLCQVTTNLTRFRVLWYL